MISNNEGRLTVPERADLKRLESVIDKGKQTFIEVGSALKQIRDDKLYRESWTTFEGYCEDRFEFGRSYAHRLIEASETVEKVKMLPIGNKIEIKTETQARELAKVPEENWQEVIDEVAEIQAETGKPSTAKTFKAAAEKVAAKDEPLRFSTDEEYEPPKPTTKEQVSKLRSVALQHYKAAMRAVDDMNELKRDRFSHQAVVDHNTMIQDAVTGGWK